MSLNGLQIARRRRQVRATIVLALAALLVTVGLLFAIRNINAPGALPSGSATSTCAAKALPQAGFTLNIYNASGPSGSASSVATQFATGGFKIGTVSNDPYKQKIDGVAQIRYGKGGEAFAKQYVERAVPGAQLSPDGRTDNSVDVVIGKQFRASVAKTPTAKTC
ncbi:MAG: LytR C-terminal domain-containing protein [Actinomycetota bacterium]|nr:LytR C-terminal domain-containing protein [Actinomycetota bacterium]